MNIKKEVILIILGFILFAVYSIVSNSYVLITAFTGMSIVIYIDYRNNPTKDKKILLYLYGVVYFLVGIGLLLMEYTLW